MFARDMGSRAVGHALPVSDGWPPPAPPCIKPCSAEAWTLASDRRSAEPLLEVPLHLAADVAVGDLPAAITALLALGESQLELRPRSLEVDAHGYQRQAALRGLPDQPLDLAAVEQQLPGTVEFVVLVGRRKIGRYVRSPEPHLSAVDHGVCLVDLGLAVPQGLHLTSLQLDTGLHTFEDLELVPRSAIRRDVATHRLAGAFRLLCHQLRSRRPPGFASA